MPPAAPSRAGLGAEQSGVVRCGAVWGRLGNAAAAAATAGGRMDGLMEGEDRERERECSLYIHKQEESKQRP